MISNLEQAHKPRAHITYAQPAAASHRATQWGGTCILPRSLLVGSQEDFDILVDVLHSAQSFEEILGN